MRKAFLVRIMTGTVAEDAALRELLRETGLQGAIPVTLEREPSFFGADVDVQHHDVAMAMDGERALCCGSRVVRVARWNGRSAPVAYLADLRVHPCWQKRAGRLLREGFRHLFQLAIEHPAAVTWTAVFASNQKALDTLAGARAGLPAYGDRGKLVCALLWSPPRARARQAREDGCRRATSEDWPAMVDFFNAHSGKRPLAPELSREDFARGRWPGLDPGDFALLEDGGKLAGMVAVWDQRAFRQIRVASLPRWMAWLRVPLGFASRWRCCPRLPAKGSVMAVAQAAFLAVTRDDPVLTGRLLRAASALAGARGLDFLCACLHERDPKAAGLAGLPATAAHGRLFQVIASAPEPWTDEVPYIDPAFL